MENDEHYPCTAGCFFGWGFFGAMAGLVLFIIFGIFALVPAGPFDERHLTLGIVLVVLGATGVSSFGGYLACAVPGAAVGLVIDKACSLV
ncbi:unnamed protein product [Calypogeia fissa]